MATLISAATGNLTAAGTWKKVAAAGLLDCNSTPSSTALTTGNLDSATFVLGATQIDAVAIKLASRATGSPSNTLTVKLRNSTTSTDIFTVTVNVSDLTACANTGTADREGGWYVFNPGATHTPNGTDSYLIRLTLSATSTAVAFYTNGTANNWARMVRETTTQAPAAGDNLIIAGDLTGAGTGNNVVVTMDSTANTDYGAASTVEYNPAISVNARGTLAYGTTAATNYILRVSGYLAVYSGGTFTIGTVATPIPRDGTAVLEFDCAASADFGLVCSNGSTVTMQGLSRTSGKNAVWALLTANMAAAATSATIDTDTGWLSGDVVVCASTSRTPGDNDLVTLNANAGASSLAWTGGTTYAHAGTTTEPMQGEVILLTRNVLVRSTLSTAYTFGTAKATATIDLDWVDFRYWGNNSTRPGWNVLTGTGGSFTFSYCCVRDSNILAIYISGTPGTGTVTIEHSVGYRLGITASLLAGFVDSLNASGGANHSFNDLVGVYCVGSLNYMFRFADIAGSTYTSLRSIGHSRSGGISFWLTNVVDGSGKTFGPFTAHSGSDAGVNIYGLQNATIGTIRSWRNGSYGLDWVGALRNVTFTALSCWGNVATNITASTGASGSAGVVFQDLQLAGDSAFATTTGFTIGNGLGFLDFRIDKGDFGTVSGVKQAHATNDFSVGALTVVRAVINNCLLTASNLFSSATYGALASVWGFSRFNRTAASHRAYTTQGTVFIETTTFDVTPSMKLTPLSATIKLDSAAGLRGRGFLVTVANGATAYVTVRARKDGSYTGAAPRLILKSNSGMGFDVDVVCATLSVAANTWETLTYTTAAVTDNGVLEFVVDCDGTAGNVFADTWTAA